MPLQHELAARLALIADRLMETQRTLNDVADVAGVNAIRAARQNVVNLRDDYASLPADAKLLPSHANELVDLASDLERRVNAATGRAAWAIKSAMMNVSDLIAGNIRQNDKSEWAFVRD